MPSPILARADALMQRRRRANEVDDVPVLTDAVSIEDDIPVLVDVVAPMRLIEHCDDLAMESPVESNQVIPELAASELAASELAASELAASELAASEPAVFEPAVFDNAVSETAIRDTLARELAHRVQERITAELPRIIESTLRDFLAERAVISTLTSQD